MLNSYVYFASLNKIIYVVVFVTCHLVNSNYIYYSNCSYDLYIYIYIACVPIIFRYLEKIHSNIIQSYLKLH